MKILVIEDNSQINKNIVNYLILNWYFAKWLFDWESWLQEAMVWDYDIILLDIMLPWIDWLEVCRSIQNSKKTPIIMITAFSTAENKLTGFDAGADDYIVKPFDLKEMVSRIQAVLRRRYPDSQVSQKFRDLSIDLKSKSITKSWLNVDLTNKELLIIEYLLNHKWEAVTRTDLISYVWWWDDSLFTSDQKLDVYISNIRKKTYSDFIFTIKWFWYKINEIK